MIAIALLFILIFCRARLLALCAVLGSRNKERQGLDYVSGVEQTFHLGPLGSRVAYETRRAMGKVAPLWRASNNPEPRHCHRMAHRGCDFGKDRSGVLRTSSR
jgi:hypothetical protein